MKVINEIKSGLVLDDLMLKKGITNEEIAVMVCCATSSISAWRNGVRVPRLNHLVNIARVLNVKVSDLLVVEDL